MGTENGPPAPKECPSPLEICVSWVFEFDDAARFDNGDLVRRADRCETAGDVRARSSTHQPVEGERERPLVLAIERVGGLVEDQEGRAFGDCPCELIAVGIMARLEGIARHGLLNAQVPKEALCPWP